MAEQTRKPLIDIQEQSVPPSSELALLTIEDVAEILKVPVSWVYARTRRRATDRIPGFRLGKYWRFRESDLLAWLDRQRAGGRTNA